jgi:hypothetical protein
VEEELDQEVRSYFDTMVERRISQGVTREEALRSARLAFGDPERVKEKVREARMGAEMETTFQDIRYAFRALRKNPGFAIVAVLSLGLGLGANVAVFTLVNTVMLKSLPVKDANRLFFIDSSAGKEGGGSGPPYPCYERLRDNNHHFSGMAAFSGERFKVTMDGSQEQIRGQYASGSYFEVLGVHAAIGRLLTPADDSLEGRGGPDGPVAVISYGLWNGRFGRSPAVLGKRVQVDTNWVTIVGVTQAGFRGLSVGVCNRSDDVDEQWSSCERVLVVECRRAPEKRIVTGAGSRRVGRVLSNLHGRDAARTKQVLHRDRSGSRRERLRWSAAPLLEAAADRDGDRRPGAIDRLCQRGKPVARAGRRASNRGRPAARHWRHPVSTHPAALH